MQAGITRIKIKSDWDDWRTRLEDAHHPLAVPIYRKVFNEIGMRLGAGDEIVEVSKEDAQARYDWAEGIDLILTTTLNHRMTMQSKFLTYTQSTATFEESKTSGVDGAWYYCTAQYYFVGYTRKYWDFRKRQLYSRAVCEFQDWIMLDFAAMRRASAAKIIDWQYNDNSFDGRRARFRYVHFDNIPDNCVVARFGETERSPVQLELFNTTPEG